jgi:hypothetical protein
MGKFRHFEWLARVGYTARGVVFLMLGSLTALAAFGARSRPLDGKDALRLLLSQPFGAVLLALIAAGLLCFAIWRAAQAVLDADACGDDLKGIARRVGYGAGALFYGAFASIAFSLLLGVDNGSQGDSAARDWTAWLLAKPAGQWIIAAIGLAIVATGVGTAVVGLRAEFRHRLALAEKPRLVVTMLGIAGSMSRALVLAMIGLFLLFAALDLNAREAAGFAGALRIIQNQPHGALLLGITAAGLAAFGLYELAEAAFRRIAGRRGDLAGQPSCLRTKPAS